MTLNLDERLKIVATGTGRCGTTFFTRLLQSVGRKCGHEQVFSQNILYLNNARKWDADSSLFAMPFVKEFDPQIKVVHLVRSPVACIESFLQIGYFDGSNWSAGVMQFWVRHCSESFDQENDDSRAVAYWVDWNKMMSGFHFRHRIEDDPAILLSRLGIEWEGKLDTTSGRNNQIKRKYPGRKLDRSKVDEGLWSEMVELGKEYGYGM